MDFALTEEQKQIKALIKDFFRREQINVQQAREINDRALFLKTAEEYQALVPHWSFLTDKLFEVGLAQLAVPTKYGGGGFERDLMTLTIAAEEASYYSEGAGMTVGGMIPSFIALEGTEEQQDWFFPQYMEKHIRTALTVSEPTGATDEHMPYDEGGNTVLRTYAYKDGNEWVINGQKMWGSLVAIADLILVAARTDKEAPVSQAMSLFWVPRDVPGLTIIPNRLATIGSNCQSFWDNVRVPENRILGEVNKGFRVLQTQMQQVLLLWAGTIGRTQSLYEQLREFTKERVQGGKPLIKHSYVTAMLGQIATDIDATRNLVYRAAWEIDKARQARVPTNMYWTAVSAFQAKNMWMRVANIASDLWGSLGATIDMPLHSYWQSALLSINGSTTRSGNAMKAAAEYEARYMGQLTETA